jgi:hypothetical protein
MFRDALMASQYRTNFSAWAIDKLYGHIEAYEESTGGQVELDCTAIACEYAEESFRDVIAHYDTLVETTSAEENEDGEVINMPRSDAAIIADVETWLHNCTSVIAHDGAGTFLFAQF